MIYIFKYKIFRYIFLSNLPALNISPHPRNKTRLTGNLEVETLTQNVNVTVELFCDLDLLSWMGRCFHLRQICWNFWYDRNRFGRIFSILLFNRGETLLRSGLTMHKEASLKTHVSLSHYLNQQRETLGNAAHLFKPCALATTAVPSPQVSSQKFGEGRTPI